jgi:NAD-dependent DNA ligase
MSLLEQWILVHGYIYYNLDENVVDDRTYDMNAQQLIKLIKRYPNVVRYSKYGYIFKNFEGSSAFNLIRKLKPEHHRLISEHAYFVCKGKIR